MPAESAIPSDQPLSSAQLQTVWERVSGDLRSALGEPTFDLWFSHTRLVQVEGRQALISVPGSMYAIWIEENFRDLLKSSLDKHLGSLNSFSFDFSRAEETPIPRANLFPDFPETVPATDEPARRKPARKRRPLTREEILEKGRAAGLTDVHSFDNFVVGENSAMAVAAARAVVDKPGSTYQPLFFHSASGLGKTHLLHAIGWAFLEKRPHARVLFVGAEKFANDYIDAIRNSSETAFRKKFREVDLLLIDDVQFLGGKSGFQREFFHTFNSLVNAQNQIVMTSDCLASEISELEERLVSRMQWGLTVEIGSPDDETCEAILRRKRDEWRLEVSDQAIARISGRVSHNVRQLEGALIRTALVTTMGEKELDDDRMEDLLSDMVDLERDRPISLEEIKRVVADYFNLAVRDLEGTSRTAEVTKARHVAMALCRDLTNHSLKEVAASFGKDHTSILYATKAVKAKCQKSESLRHSIGLIRRRIARSEPLARTEKPRPGRPSKSHDNRPGERLQPPEWEAVFPGSGDEPFLR